MRRTLKIPVDPRLADAPHRPGWEHAAVAGLALGHVALGLALVPDWMFSKYPDAARLLAAGKLGSEERADFSPLYLLLNALCAPGVLRWLQSFVGAAGLVAVHLTARTLFGRAAALAAAGLFAIAVPVLAYEATLEPDVWVMGFSAAGIAALTTANGRPRWTIAAGLALGLSVAARPSNALFVALAVAWSFFAGGRAWRAPALLAAVAVAISFVPSLALRSAIGPQLGATMSIGAVLHHGNRPESTGLGAQPPKLIKLLELQLRSADNPDPVHQLYRRFARSEAGHDLSPRDTEQFWIAKVAAFARAEPWAFARMLGRKLVAFAVGPDGHDIGEVSEAAARLKRLPLIRTEWLGLLGFTALALLAVRRRPVGLLAAYLASTSALAVAFYVVARYRLATVPVWCVLIAGLIPAAREATRTQRLAGAAAVLLAIFLGTSSSVAHDTARMLTRGAAAAELVGPMARQRNEGALTAATPTFVRLQAAQPYVVLTRDLRGIPFEDPRVVQASLDESVSRFGADEPVDRFLAAVLAARAGQCARVLPELEALAELGFRGAIFDASLDPLLLAAECALAAKDPTAARAFIARSLAARPGTLDGLALAVAGGDTAHEAELFALHDVLSTHYALSLAKLAFGNAEGALADADAVLVALPEAGVVHYQRALALSALGRGPEAFDAYAQALARFPAHAFPGKPLDAVVQTRLAEALNDPAVLSVAADHRLRGGDFVGARQLSQQAVQLWGPALPPAHQRLHAYLMVAK